MKKRKKRRCRKITGIKLIMGWLQSTLNQALTIAIWVIAWSIVEPYICDVALSLKLLIVLILVILLQGGYKPPE